MTLDVTTYLRMAADLRALEVQTKKAFVRALITLTDEGLSGSEAARRLGVSQAHCSRTLGALLASGLLQAAPRQAVQARGEEAVLVVPSGP